MRAGKTVKGRFVVELKEAESATHFPNGLDITYSKNDNTVRMFDRKHGFKGHLNHHGNRRYQLSSFPGFDDMPYFGTMDVEAVFGDEGVTFVLPSELKAPRIVAQPKRKPRKAKDEEVITEKDAMISVIRLNRFIMANSDCNLEIDADSGMVGLHRITKTRIA